MRSSQVRHLSVFIVLLSLLFPSAAYAEEAETLLQEGIVQFRVAKFRKSLKVLSRAKKKTKDPKILGRIYLYLGINYGVLKKNKQAKAAFTRALKLNPTQTVNPNETKDSVVALFNKVRSRLLGTLEVTSDRAAAVLQLNGKKVGIVPYKDQIKAGKYQVVVVSGDGLSRYEGEVVVYSGKEHRVQAKLVFIGARLNITSRPAGARVIIDGKERGLTPLKSLVKAGDHQLSVEIDGYDPDRRKVSLKQGSTEALDVVLKLTPVASAPVITLASQPLEGEGGEEDKPGKSRWPIWPIAAGGAALALAGAGMGLGLSAQSAWDEYQTTKDPNRYDELRDQITSHSTGSTVCFALAGAAAVTGVLLYIFVDRPASQQETPTVSVGPTGAVISLGF